jgi:hypothetical protein
MTELSETMDRGLRAMAKKVRRYGGYVMAEPNDNTGRALERRGLLEKDPRVGSVWQRYCLTDAGWAYVDAARPSSSPAADGGGE